MMWLSVCFWASLVVVVYVHVLYPAWAAIAARLFGKPPVRRGRFRGSVSIVIAAYNEQESISRRAIELLRAISDNGLQGELIIVSDGSTDHTVATARQVAQDDSRLRVIDLPQNAGKAAALAAGRAAAR